MNGQLCRWREGAVSERAWRNCRVHTRGYLVKSPARHKRLVKPTPRCNPNDYSLDDYNPDNYKPNDYSQDEYSPDDYKPIDYGQDDYSPSDYKPDDYSPDDSKTNRVKSKPRNKNRRSRARARGST
jgi:hypothetical protein